MLLNEWIENKQNELTKSKKYKSVTLSHISEAEIEKNMTFEIFDFPKKEISMNTKVEDFIRNELTEKIKGLKITFEVVIPKYRKPVLLYLYVKAI